MHLAFATLWVQILFELGICPLNRYLLCVVPAIPMCLWCTLFLLFDWQSARLTLSSLVLGVAWWEWFGKWKGLPATPIWSWMFSIKICRASAFWCLVENDQREVGFELFPNLAIHMSVNWTLQTPIHDSKVEMYEQSIWWGHMNFHFSWTFQGTNSR